MKKILILLIFMNLACVTAAKYDELKKESDLKDGRIHTLMKDKGFLETSINELEKRNKEKNERIAEFQDLLKNFKSMIDSGKLKIKIIDGRMVVVLSSDVLFDTGSWVLSKKGQDAVAEVTKILASIQNKKFQIEGHTDSVPTIIKGFTNWELASNRSLTVLHTMVNAGMPENRISASAYGSSRPSHSNDTVEGRSANRRIEIVIVPDLSSLPGFDELMKLNQ